MNKTYNIVVGVVGFLMGTGTMLYCYGRIFLTVLKQKRLIAATQVTSGTNQSMATGGSKDSVLEAIRSAKKIFIITMMYFVAYTPAVVATVAANLDYSDPIFSVCVWLNVSNSFFNSLAYILLNRSMRRALVEMFWRLSANYVFSRDSHGGSDSSGQPTMVSDRP
jgi:hypothetical protein